MCVCLQLFVVVAVGVWYCSVVVVVYGCCCVCGSVAFTLLTLPHDTICVWNVRCQSGVWEAVKRHNPNHCTHSAVSSRNCPTCAVKYIVTGCCGTSLWQATTLKHAALKQRCLAAHGLVKRSSPWIRPNHCRNHVAPMSQIASTCVGCVGT